MPKTKKIKYCTREFTHFFGGYLVHGRVPKKYCLSLDSEHREMGPYLTDLGELWHYDNNFSDFSDSLNAERMKQLCIRVGASRNYWEF